MKRLNENLWHRYERYAEARGRLAVEIISQRMEIRQAVLLDFGAGTGGASLAAAKQGARVFAVEINPQKRAELLNKIRGCSVQLHDDLASAYAAAGRFDAVILSDVVEHLLDPQRFFSSLAYCLKPSAVIYLSTPNRYSPINLLCDPHYSLPLVALFRRKNVRKAARLFGCDLPDKEDWPELMSLGELERLAKEAGFAVSLVNRRVVRYGLNHPTALWNRLLHLKIIDMVKRCRLEQTLLAMISDKPNLWNRLMMPTFYLLMQKRPGEVFDKP